MPPNSLTLGSPLESALRCEKPHPSIHTAPWGPQLSHELGRGAGPGWVTQLGSQKVNPQEFCRWELGPDASGSLSPESLILGLAVLLNRQRISVQVAHGRQAGLSLLTRVPRS